MDEENVDMTDGIGTCDVPPPPPPSRGHARFSNDIPPPPPPPPPPGRHAYGNVPPPPQRGFGNAPPPPQHAFGNVPPPPPPMQASNSSAPRQTSQAAMREVRIPIMGQRWLGMQRVKIMFHNGYYGTIAHVRKLDNNKHEVIYFDGNSEVFDDAIATLVAKREVVQHQQPEDAEVAGLAHLLGQHRLD